MAQAAGHDLNYIAMSGALSAIGRSGQKPTPPLNLVGDYGGGALYLVVGVLAALLETQKSGKGQVVDAAMVDGAASLMAAPFGMFAAGLLTKNRGANVLDSGAYFYDSYECKDGKFVSVAAIESKFHAEMFRLMELDITEVKDQMDRQDWPRLKKMMEMKFKTKTRDEWTAVMGGSDACFAPVLEMDEVADDPHNRCPLVSGLSLEFHFHHFLKSWPILPIHLVFYFSYIELHQTEHFCMKFALNRRN
jgi:crotonobetainyl-CoA:carnitine CoA-transferase CaiB-like acyl-CoA transferase